jgi:hypothetical protein
MTDEQRKRLTGYLGECWDADKRLGGDLPNRTFDTDVDMMALFRKMVDNEKISRSAAIRLECPCYKFLYSMGG